MRAIRAGAQIKDLSYRAKIQFAVKMRKQLATARRLPLQRIAKLVSIDRDQKKSGLAGEMLGESAGELGRCGEMNEAIAPIVSAAAIGALTLGLAPCRGGANFVNRGHRFVGFG